MSGFLKKRLSLKRPSRKPTMSSIASTSSTETNASTPSKASSSTSQTKGSSTKGSSPNSKTAQQEPKPNTNTGIEDVVEEEGSETDVSIDQRDVSLLPDITKNPLEEVTLTAAGLGILFGCAITSLLVSKCKSAGIYISSLALFHFLEFYVTAKYNPKKVHKESFIINNGSAYTLAHTFAILELVIEYTFFPHFKASYLWLKTIGFSLIVIGQVIRYVAMKTAGQSFSHLVVTKHEAEHELVVHGVYSIFRHPSYFGFFWWAVGTQLVLLNPIGLTAFVLVLWNFFDERIRYEERFLVSFFGERYVNYRNSTPVYIPFIN